MKMFIRTLYAELLKFKRTLALALVVVAPAAIVSMQLLTYLRPGMRFPADRDPWMWFAQSTVAFWGLIVLPLFVTLETALAGSLEHRGEHWKHLFALPVPRGLIYAAKQCSGMALIAISSALLPIFVLLGGGLLRLLRPNFGLTGAAPLGRLFVYMVPVYLGAWLIISIQTWINLRWKNFVLSSAVGITMTVVGMAAISSEWGSYYPWALPGVIANSFNEEGFAYLSEMIFGSVGGALVALLGGWDVTRQDVL